MTEKSKNILEYQLHYVNCGKRFIIFVQSQSNERQN